ncbi:hypothetical protein OIV83_002520 [Microbotryomycetes sp. JL201]|nr:hypothetical protein OIV83_002520 [Microbotryomycetes sp. JL201]
MQQIAQSLPEWSDQELETVYRGLMNSTPHELRQIEGLLDAPDQTGLLLSDGAWSEKASLDRTDRLRLLNARVDSLRLGNHAQADTPQSSIEQTRVSASSPQEILNKVIQLHVGRQPTFSASSLTSSLRVEDQQDLPRGLLTRSEWQDVVLACAEEGSVQDVMRALEAMQQYVPLQNGEILARLLEKCADEGRPRDAMALAHFAKENALPLSTIAHHHVLRSLVPDHPEMAVQHLHSLEAAGYTPLIESYTVVIDRLLSPESPPYLVSRGWDLYAHTRLVSHPTPSAKLFTTMIQACSRSAVPSPERALDLFTEMTTDNNLVPSEETYNAVIRTCTREGSLENYFEGLRLMRQMLDENIMPTKHTFHALLEGARRHGDLARARWMLVKMVGVGGHSAPDANTLGLVFQTYSTYRTPIRGAIAAKTRVQAEIAVSGSQRDSGESSVLGETAQEPVRAGDDDSEAAGGDAHLDSKGEMIELLGEDSLFYPGPLPQTTSEVLQEARILFLQCSQHRIRDSDVAPRRSASFADVRPTTFLLNSYQSVLARHAPFNDFVQFFDAEWTGLNIRKNRFTFEEAMLRSETAKNREAGLAFARKVFEEWKEVSQLARHARNPEPRVANGVESECGHSDDQTDVGQGVNVSRMWASMIRHLARCFQLDDAKALLQRFYEQYPPGDIIKQAHMQSVQARSLPRQPSLVRMSSSLYPETIVGSKGRLFGQDHVPYLLFEQVKVLHLRLANIEDEQGVKLVAQVCGDYAKAVKVADKIRNEALPLVGDKVGRTDKVQQERTRAIRQ